MNGYTASIFGPAMLAEFGWSRADFAFAGAFGFMSLICTPIAGRLVDAFGYRVAGIIGFLTMSASYFALSMMTGDIRQYYAIIIFKNIFGVLTTSMVFSRIVVARFHAARGFALAIPASASPLVGSLAVLTVGAVLATDGWRAGYQVLSFACFVAGVLAIMLCGREERVEAAPSAASVFDWQDIARVLRCRAAILLMAGMFLVNLPQIVMSSQLGILLADRGVTPGFIVWLVSLYPIGITIGRFSTGIMLDLLRPHVVALAMLTLPAIGLAVLATGVSAEWVLTLTVLVIGVSQGAEGDVGAYLASRKFALRHYSFVFSLIFATVGIGTSTGALLLSYSLELSSNYASFLMLSVAATLVGALCFFATGWCPDAAATAPAPESESALTPDAAATPS